LKAQDLPDNIDFFRMLHLSGDRLERMLQYGAIARDEVILCQCALAGGDFDVTIREVLKRVNVNEAEFAYEKDRHLYFLLREASGLSYVIAGGLDTREDLAFSVLHGLQRAFLTSRYSRSWQGLSAYSLQSEFSGVIRNLMTSGNERINPPRSPVAGIHDAMEVLDINEPGGLVLEDESEERTKLWPRIKNMIWEHQQGFAIALVLVAAILTVGLIFTILLWG
jgi:hypothetical protein